MDKNARENLLEIVQEFEGIGLRQEEKMFYVDLCKQLSEILRATDLVEIYVAEIFKKLKQKRDKIHFCEDF